MAAGFEVYANDGSLMLNNNMIGWFCAKSGTGTTIAGAANGVGNTTPGLAVIPVSGYSYPLSAIRIHGDGHVAARYTNQWQSGDHRYATSAGPGTGFNWYVYDYAPRLPAVYVGMETYTDSGDRSFSTAYMPFKPVKNVNGDSLYYPGHELAVCGPSLSGYAQAGEITYYRRDTAGRYFLIQDDEVPSHYRVQRDAKLEGASVTNSDYCAGGVVSFDDTMGGYAALPVSNSSDWSVYSPALAIDVSNIPVPGNFF